MNLQVFYYINKIGHGIDFSIDVYGHGYLFQKYTMGNISHKLKMEPERNKG